MRLGFRSLQQKLNAYALVLCVSSMGAMGVLTYTIARKQVRQGREQLMEVFARQLSQDISRELREASADLQLWARSDSVQVAVTSLDDRTVHAVLSDVSRQHPRYELIVVLDGAGRVRGTDSETARHFSEIVLSLPPHWLETVAASDKLQGIPWVRVDGSSEIQKKERASLETTYHTILATPIVDSDGGGVPGTVIAVINWSQMQRILDSAESGFRALELSTGYALLLANDKLTTIGHKYRVMYGTNLIRDHNLPQFYERLKTNPTGTIRYRWREGWKIMAIEKIQPQGLGPEFEWYLGVGINDSDIFAPVNHLLSWFLLASAGVMAAIVLVTRVAGRTISVSLHEFAQLARDAARGRFSQLARARTDDEVGILAQAFNEMLVSFRAQIPFTQIPNHYVVGNPVRSAQMFFGRQEDLQWIGQQLERRGNKMILLFGPRRIGKTSLLHQIVAGNVPAQVIPFFFDTQQIMPEVHQDGDFYHVLVREMMAQLPKVVPDARAPFISAERFTPDTLRRLLGFLRDTEPEHVPVLLFDELENLEYKFSRGALSPDLLLFAAALLDGDTPVSFVVTGSDQMGTLKGPHWGVLVPKTVPRRIGLLSPSEALRLIEEPVRGHVLYDDGVPASIIRVTAGHPYYTQVICQAIVDYLNLKREFAFGPENLREVLDEVLNNPPPPLNHVWENFTASQKVATSTLAQAIPDETVFLTPDTILEAAPKELRPELPDVSVLRRSLNSLLHDDWVESDGPGYRFRIDLLRLWLLREHSVWQVADELQRSSVP